MQRKARSIFLFLLAVLLQVSAKVHAQEKINLSEKNASLEKVFGDIQKQTSYNIWFDKALLDKTSLVNINLRDASLEQALIVICAGQPLEFSIVGKSVVIKEKWQKKSNPPGKITIKGRVTDEKGMPLEGANVFIKGTHNGTETDPNGFFELKADQNNLQLEISFSGYTSKTIGVFGSEFIRVLLSVSTNPLDIVQKIAYGTTSRRLNTGDISTITEETISRQPVSNPLAALEGQAPGLVVIQNTGVPGGGFTVQIRGQNSIRFDGNNPFYIVDGVPFSGTGIGSAYSAIIGQGSPLSTISPSEIESIEILKDAAATSIYGSRGANGVILITTKKGKAGKTEVNANISTGWGNVNHEMPLLNTTQYLEMRHEAFRNDGIIPDPSTTYAPDLFIWDTTRYTNWQKELTGGTAYITDAQLSISGGNENTKFLLGGNFRRETTVFPGDYNYNRSNGHINLQHTSTDKKFSLSFSAIYSLENNNILSLDLMNQALTLAPDAPAVFDSAGNLNWTGNYNNPFGYLKDRYSIQTNNLVSDAVLSYQFSNSLQGKLNLGYTKINTQETGITPTSSFNPAYQITSGFASFAESSVQTTIIEPQLLYHGQFGFNHLQVQVGLTFLQDLKTAESQLLTGFSSDALLTNKAAGSQSLSSTSNYSKYRYEAAFGRINYNWDEEFLVDLTGRRDGSSRFGPGKQFANFWAVGLGWIFTKLTGMQSKLPWMSFGKLRASYGTTGNDQIGDYQYLDSYTTTDYPYQGSSGLYPVRLFNPNYEWEINHKLEFGLELGFIKDRIFISGSYYENRSSNQLVGYPLPLITGFSFVQGNLPAKILNTGIEVQFNASILKSNRFSWNSSLNLTFPSNRLISFPNLSATSYANSLVVGQSLKIVKAFHVSGLDGQTGIYQFTNSEGHPTTSPVYPDDLTNYKKITQKYYGGFQNNFQYKGWELAIFFQFVEQTGRNYLYNNAVAPGMFGNQPTYVLNRWQKPGDQASVQKFTQDYSSEAYAAYSTISYLGDNTISDASFIRLKNVSLSYILPLEGKKVRILKAAKIYLQGQNLITWTNYLGPDPENQTMFSLPPLRIISLGAQLTF